MREKLLLLVVLLVVPACGTLAYQDVPAGSPVDPTQAVALQVGQRAQDAIEAALPSLVGDVIDGVENFAFSSGWMKAPVAPVVDEEGQPARDKEGRVIWDWQPAAGVLGVLAVSVTAWWRSRRWAEVKTEEVNGKRRDLAVKHFDLERRVRDMEVRNGGGLSYVGTVAGGGTPS